MTVAQKISVSLLISVILFALFAAIAFTGLFKLVETRFYNPAVTKGLTKELSTDATVMGDYLSELQTRFGLTLAEESVKRSFLPNQSSEDVFERSRIFGKLLESVSGLQSVRFIEAAGKHIHFSTNSADILKQDRFSVAYKNYGDADGDLSYETVSVVEDAPPRIVVDAQRDRILFAFPFLDSFNVYKGSALFAVSVRALTERLTTEGRLHVSEDLTLIATPAGAVSGLPRIGRDTLVSAVSSLWKDGVLGPSPLAEGDSGSSYALISAKTESGFFIGRIVNATVFSFPQAMKGILLSSFFLTTYLVVFLLFNLRQDSVTIIRDRIKRLQITLLEEYYDRKGDLDWGRWSRELEQRRDEVRLELKRNLGRGIRKKAVGDIDELIDKSWDELISAVGGRSAPPQLTAQIDEGRLQDILGRVLAAAPALAPPGHAVATTSQKLHKPGPVPPDTESPPEAIAPLEEVADIEEVEAIEEPEEIEEVEAVEEPEYLEEVEVAEKAEGAEEIEELEEVEALEEVETLEEAEAVEEPEDIEEVEVAEKAEGAEEIEELEEIEALEEVETLEEAEAVEEPEDLEGVEVVEKAEGFEDAESIEEFESADKIETPPFSESNLGTAKAPSNIDIVFGDDDIPYIVETSGLELVDDEVKSIRDFLEIDEAAFLEELPPDTEEIPRESPDVPQQMAPSPQTLLNEVAWNIEISTPKKEPAEEVALPALEVTSPFDTILSEFFSPTTLSNVVEEKTNSGDSSLDEIEPAEESMKDEVPEELEELEETTELSPAYQSFFSAAMEPEALESLGGDNEEERSEEMGAELLEIDEDSIEFRDGIAYVTDAARKGLSGEVPVDPELKSLVDSLLPQNSKKRRS